MQFSFRQRLWVLAAPLCMSLATPSIAADAMPRVAMDTSMGRIVLELNPQRAPKTVDNFLQYVRDGHYDGTIFHRVIQGFMIQGGGFTPDLREKQTRAPIPLEARGGLPNLRYTIAMARTSDPNSATSQFFINVNNNDFLNANQAQDGYGYTVFGKVIEGFNVVEQIAATKTGSRGWMGDVPTRPIIIQKVSVLR